MNRKSYFQTVLAALLERPLSEHSFQVNPIQDHFFRAERARPALTFSSTSETLCYEAQFQLLSFWRIAPLLLGLWLFYNARHLSSVLSFHYFGGMSVGVLLAGLGLVFLVARMVPRRGGFVAVFLGGSTFMAWLSSKFYDQALDIIQSYPWLVTIYIGVTAILSFVACYWFEDNLKSPRYQRIAAWFLQLMGLILVLASSWNIFLNIFIIFVLLANEFLNFATKYKKHSPEILGRFGRSGQSATPTNPAIQKPNFFSPIKLFNRRPFRPQLPKKTFLTEEQFQEQGKVETDAALNALRDSIRQSPDPWKVLKKLKPETRAKLIDFVDSGDHLTEDTWEAAEDETEEDDLFEHEAASPSSFGTRPGHSRSTGHYSPGFTNGRREHSVDLRRKLGQKSVKHPSGWRY